MTCEYCVGDGDEESESFYIIEELGRQCAEMRGLIMQGQELKESVLRFVTVQDDWDQAAAFSAMQDLVRVMPDAYNVLRSY